MILHVIVWFFAAAAADALGVWWQEARERREALKCAVLAVLLEAISWGPVVAVLYTGHWAVIAACLAGSWVGSYLGVRHASATK
jgi:hypothetical protein